jgi:hypothetical protein
VTQPHAAAQLLGQQSHAQEFTDGDGRITDVDAAMRALESRHRQQVVKMAHDMNIEHAKAMEAQRKEVEAKDTRIENIVATLGKVLNEREFLKNELQRAGHHNVIMKMKAVAAGERDMLKSIKDQITGKKSAAVEDRGMQTMEVQFADDRDSDSDGGGEGDAAAAAGVRRGGGSSRAGAAAALVKGGAKGDVAAALKQIYDSSEKGKKKGAKGGQDWGFMDVETFKKEVARQVCVCALCLRA